MATRQTALFACILSAVFSASAHDAPRPGTCTAIGARQVTIGSFRFTEKTLLREREQHSPLTCPLASNGSKQEVVTPREEPGDKSSGTSSGETPDAGPAAKCGVVDDYHIGMMTIVKYCNDPKLGNGQASFRVARPASYSAKDHHKRYTFSDGDLIGTCYICVVRGPIKLGPARQVEATPLD